MDKQLRLRLLAAGIGIALGSTAALAQPGADDETAQQRQAQQDQPAQQQDQDPASQQRQAQQDQAERQRQTQQDQAGQQESQERQQVARAGDSTQIDQLSQRDQELSRFVEALKTTGMADALTDGTEYTIFAPTNDAFENMQGRSLEELQQPGGEELTGLLRAHIVADDVDQEMARNLQAAQTIDGGTVELSMEDDQLMVGDATVQGEPIEVGSLRVYKIDSVLEPDPGASLTATEDEERTDVALGDEREAEDEGGIFGGDEEEADEDRDGGIFGGDREVEQEDQRRQ